MSFLSIEFALFLAVGLLGFHLAPSRYKRHVLLALSYLFYFSASVLHTLLLLGTTVSVYLAARAIERSRTDGGKLRLTGVAVAGLLMVLTGFKYTGWLIETLQTIWSKGGAEAVLLLVAPLGLSYYLFKMMGYLLDVYWDKIPVEHNFISFALFVAFFPQIVSGPIQRAQDFLPQLEKFDRPDPAALTAGLRRILFGLFKKLVIADRLAGLVAGIHANPATFSPLELLLGAYLFALQLYADFSGITDIALGLGLLFGVKGPENFRLPFFAQNVQDFWRRWHISLSSWLSDYLFIPLRMALRRMGNVGLSVAIFINMVAIGLWHGPTRHYIIFGALNGVYMVVSALTLKKRNAFFRSRPLMTRLRNVAGPLLTFNLMAFAFIFFRANSLPLALKYVKHLIPGLSVDSITALRLDWTTLGLARSSLVVILACAVVMEVLNWAGDRPVWRVRFLAAPRILRWALYYAAICMILYFGNSQQQFIYFQF